MSHDSFVTVFFMAALNSFVVGVDGAVKLTVVLNCKVMGHIILRLATLFPGVLVEWVRDNSVLPIVLGHIHLPIFYCLIKVQLDLLTDLKVNVMLDDLHFVAQLALVLRDCRSALDLADHTVVLYKILSVNEVIMILV